jgi:hypothetical protein
MTLKRFIDEVVDPRIFRPRPVPKKSKVAIVAERIAERRDDIRALNAFDRDLLQANAQRDRSDWQVERTQRPRAPACAGLPLGG